MDHHECGLLEPADAPAISLLTVLWFWLIYAGLWLLRQ
jgi:hypothetical protein